MRIGRRAGKTALRLVGQLTRERAEEVRRDVTRPWRQGREGPVAETGRWIGVGLAVGAVVGGALTALYATRRGG